MDSYRIALISHLDATGQSLRAVCEQAGVSYEQMKKVKQNKSKSTNVDDAVRIANHFGKSLDEFLKSESAAKNAEILALLGQLSDEDRLFLINAAKARITPDR